MTLIVRYGVSRQRPDSPEFYSVTEESGQLACDCPGFVFRQTCRHVTAVQRYRKWRINLPTDRVLPPPAAWLEREIHIAGDDGQTDSSAQ